MNKAKVPFIICLIEFIVNGKKQQKWKNKNMKASLTLKIQQKFHGMLPIF
jgi:hypothetical protein